MSIKAETLTKEKINGRYYTPNTIVGTMLDMSGYSGTGIIKKHVMENSCGDGAFLCDIVRRYCDASKALKKTDKELKKDLETYIHGIEIDASEWEKCINNVNEIAAQFEIYNINWDVRCADTLKVTDYTGKMDYVIGNPPYVRVHNLSNYDAVKKYHFADGGMTDLYIVFYEIGLSMLNNNGILCYINPSSIFNSVAAKTTREYLYYEGLITKVLNLKHYQPFNATAYTTIFVLSKNNKDRVVEYFEYNENNNTAVFIDNIKYDDFYIGGLFYFAENKTLARVRGVIECQPKKTVFDVKNGFATLCDSFFIGNIEFDKYTIPVIKASTGQRHKCFFPYDENGKIILYKTLVKDPAIKKYYADNETLLRERSLENSDDWHVFGRSQGINDVRKKKYAINALIRCVDDIKLIPCDSGVGVYSGLYILTELEYDDIKDILLTPDFVEYVTVLSKYKSGGYYTYSSKDLLRYLEYKYNERSDCDCGQLGIFGCSENLLYQIS